MATSLVPPEGGGIQTRTMSSITGWQLIADQVMQEQAGAPLNLSGGSDNSSVSDELGRLSHHSSGSSLHNRVLNTSRSQDTSFIVPKSHASFFSEYCLLEEIGRGAYGRVAKARRRADGRLVVVKEIRHACLTQKEKDSATNEVDVLASMSHPNIVRYYDCFSSGENLHIVMEWCDVGDLGTFIKGRQGQLLPEADVMLWFVQICLALQHVHQRGILHRDLKTCNIFCTSNNLVKLGDFGISKIMTHEASMASTVVGTPYYLSPEICNSKPYGIKSDIWALGCILYEMCTLRRAFEGDALTAIVLKVIRGQYEPVPDCYSPELRALVAQMLSLEPSQRPSAGQILDMPLLQDYIVQYSNMTAALAPSLSNVSQMMELQGPRSSSESPDRLSGSPSTMRLGSPFARSEVQWLCNTRISHSSNDSPTGHLLNRGGSSGMVGVRDMSASPAGSSSMRDSAEGSAAVYRSRSGGAGPSMLQHSNSAASSSTVLALSPSITPGIAAEAQQLSRLSSNGLGSPRGYMQSQQSQQLQLPADGPLEGVPVLAHGVGPSTGCTPNSSSGGADSISAHRHSTAMLALKPRSAKAPARTSSMLATATGPQSCAPSGLSMPGGIAASAPSSLHSTMKGQQGVPLMQLPLDIQNKLSSAFCSLARAPSTLSVASSQHSVAEEAFPATSATRSSSIHSLGSLRASIDGVSRNQSSEMMMAEEQRQALSKLQQLKLQLTIGRTRSVTTSVG